MIDIGRAAYGDRVGSSTAVIDEARGSGRDFPLLRSAAVFFCRTGTIPFGERMIRYIFGRRRGLRIRRVPASRPAFGGIFRGTAVAARLPLGRSTASSASRRSGL